MFRSFSERVLVGEFLEGRDLSWHRLNQLKDGHGILHLLREQKTAADNAARKISGAIHDGANLLTQEIRLQNEALQAIQGELENVADCVLLGAEQITRAIAESSHLICGHLLDIEWVLKQSDHKLGAILQTLRESRSNDARQLHEQAVQHYALGQWDRAKERLLRAIEADSTNYDALMHLGLVAFHLDDPSGAKEHFYGAAFLPRSLPPLAKGRALEMLAHTHYGIEDYLQAMRLAQQALKLIGSDGTLEFRCAIYAARAGYPQEAKKHLLNAILLDSRFFGKASSHDELARHFLGLHPWLVELTRNKQFELLALVRQCEHHLALARDTQIGAQFLSAIGEAFESTNWIRAQAHDIGYSACAKAAKQIASAISSAREAEDSAKTGSQYADQQELASQTGNEYRLATIEKETPRITSSIAGTSEDFEWGCSLVPTVLLMLFVGWLVYDPKEGLDKKFSLAVGFAAVAFIVFFFFFWLAVLLKKLCKLTSAQTEVRIADRYVSAKTRYDLVAHRAERLNRLTTQCKDRLTECVALLKRIQSAIPTAST